jgi:tetratricopeptide (TPR) repeat protein
MNTQQPPVEFSDAMDAIWGYCISLIAGKLEYPIYIKAVSSHYASNPLFQEQGFPLSLVRCLARNVWRSTPHPAYRFARPPMPTPERNAPCHCGSGIRYRLCCLDAETHIQASEVNFLAGVLRQLTLQELAALHTSKVPLDALEDAIHTFREEGLVKEICAILEPWFASDASFRAQNEILLDSLLDAYTDVPRPRKKAQLLARAIQAGDRRIRSVAMQRKVTMVADDGDYPAAWGLFTEAQRADPQSPSLSHLEITLLMMEGRGEDARARARFWKQRFAAQRDPALADLMAFLQQVVDKGAAAFGDIYIKMDPVLEALATQLHAAPPVASLYALSPVDGRAGPLKPKPALSKALRGWDRAQQRAADASFLDDISVPQLMDTRVLSMLTTCPALWNSFEVLGELVGYARSYGNVGVTEALARPLLMRAEQVLREVLRANHAEGMALEWSWLQNRPALALLGDAIAMDGPAREGAPNAERLARMEWLVRTLNPNDNQGFRFSLMLGYLAAGRTNDALALSDNYPDDFAAMRYSRALALYMNGQAGAALVALADAVSAYPKVLACLLKAKPARPKPGRFGVAVGGDEEAWLYRTESLWLWQQSGALEWAQTVGKAVKKMRG